MAFWDQRSNTGCYPVQLYGQDAHLRQSDVTRVGRRITPFCSTLSCGESFPDSAGGAVTAGSVGAGCLYAAISAAVERSDGGASTRRPCPGRDLEAPPAD